GSTIWRSSISRPPSPTRTSGRGSGASPGCRRASSPRQSCDAALRTCRPPPARKRKDAWRGWHGACSSNRMGRLAGVVVVVLLLAVSSAAAQAVPPDADGDGVADAVDACPDTPPFDVVDASGCSVCECDPDPAWDSRLDYLRCVSAAVHARRADGTLSRK